MTSRYDTTVLADGPVGYWPLDDVSSTITASVGTNGTYTATPGTTTLPNGDGARAFNGSTQYGEVPDADAMSVTVTGALTVEAWMRPDVLEFAHAESTNYVHWLSKGTSGQHEWVMRMYSLTTTDVPPRPNRISGYCFNPAGSLGSGSYFEDTVVAGTWIHVALVINMQVSPAYPTGYTKIFKNGVVRDQDRLADFAVVPLAGTAPMRIGSRDSGSFFEGAVGKVAIYNYELPASQLREHYAAMTGTAVPVHRLTRVDIGGYRVVDLL